VVLGPTHQDFLVVPNVTAHHLSTASVPVTVFVYSGPLLCGFIVPVKWLNPPRKLKALLRP